jgi:hypothetical protein
VVSQELHHASWTPLARSLLSEGRGRQERPLGGERWATRSLRLRHAPPGGNARRALAPGGLATSNDDAPAGDGIDDGQGARQILPVESLELASSSAQIDGRRRRLDRKQLPPNGEAGYLAGTNGTLGLSASTTPGPYNVTAAVPSGTDPSAAFLTPMVLSAAVVASASAYGVYRLGCYCLSGQPTAASQSSATDIAEAVLLREV